MSDLIDREEAIDALWKSLYEYEDKTEKQYQEAEDLDLGDWICHRIFVQNMSDIDRQTILNLPSADAVPVIRCKDCKYATKVYRLCLPWLTQWEYSCRYYNTHSVMGDDWCSRAERKEE